MTCNVLPFLSILILVNIVRTDIIVETNLGKVSGKEVISLVEGEKYFSFMGIPYAKPPTAENELRFMPPQSHEGWSDTLDGTKEKSACAQFFLPVRSVTNYGFFGDEDCLHLSVHTPKLPFEEKLTLPVIAFVLNDQFKMSYNGSRDYAPDFFMKENVIVITINHRLGALGFASFEDDFLPGNNGLKDIILALKWVKENIAKFGGDPNNVTLMGSQGGSVAVDILLQSPKTKGLFNRVILQSGTSWNSMYFPGIARKRAVDLSESLEWGASTSKTFVKFLNRLPVSEIINKELDIVHADEAREIQRGRPAFSPELEHDHSEAVITKLPEEASLDINVPIMIGYNSREGIELSERYLRKPQYLTFADRDFLMLFPIRTKYHFKINDMIYGEAVDDIKKFYFDEGYVKVSKPGEYITYIGDVMTFYSIDYTVRQYVNISKAPVYYYNFDYSGDFNIRKKHNLKEAINFDGTWGATTGDELCYLFVCQPIRKTYVKALEDENSEEIKVLQNMVKMWTNFAKYSNPTPPEADLEVTWTPASNERKECLIIGEDLNLKTKVNQGRVKFWDKFLEKYEKLAVDGIVKDVKDEL